MPENLEKSFISWSFYLAVLAGLIGTFVLVGWQFNADFLKHPLSGFKEINPAAAVVFITSAFYYLLLTGAPGFSRRTFALRFKISSGITLAILVLLTGSLKLFSIFFGFQFPDR